ncbi:hypothetical protein [Rhizobium leguminosarum]|uniref:hypothetical protein n=1 Tax=Rhizobium leguminosarum TaxID=384 RepID=UPI001FE1D771|nr:hypothetical protein [Rhizobium leguminosarum]
MWWNAIPYVTSGLALVAFVWAVFLSSWLAGLRNERNKVEAAPPKDRLKALEIAAKYIGVDLKDLPPNQRQAIVLKQMELKASFEKMKLGAALVVGVIALCLVAYAVWFANAQPVARGATTPAGKVDRSQEAPAQQREVPPVEKSADIIVPPAPGETPPVKSGMLWAYLGDINDDVAAGMDSAHLTMGQSEGQASSVPQPDTWGWVPFGSLGSRDDTFAVSEDTKNHIFTVIAAIETKETPCEAAISEGVGKLTPGQRVKVIKIERFGCGLWQLLGDPHLVMDEDN